MRVFEDRPVDVSSPEEIIAAVMNDIDHSVFRFNYRGIERASAEVIH